MSKHKRAYDKNHYTIACRCAINSLKMWKALADSLFKIDLRSF